VVVGNGRFHTATLVSSDVLLRAAPITVGGETVGLLFGVPISGYHYNTSRFRLS
jgi:hypothetical protein